MKRIFVLILISVNLLAQNQIGTLQRINFIEKTFISNDTIGKWFTSQQKSFFFDEVISYNNKRYLIKYENEKNTSSQYFNYYYSTFLDSFNKIDTLVRRSNVPEDLNGPYHQNHTVAIRTQNEWILLNSWSWVAHVLSYDNTNGKFKIEEIKDVRHLTKVRNNIFLYVLDDVSAGKAGFFIKDFNEFNSLTKNDEVFFEKSTEIWSPFKIMQLRDSLYLIEQEWDRKNGLHLVKLNNNIFSGTDTVQIGSPIYFGKWIYKAPYLFYSSSYNLYRRKYDEHFNKFSPTEKIVPNFTVYSIDQDERFLFSSFRDTLKVFSLEEQKIIYKVFLDKSFYYFHSKIMVDPPFIYLHKLLETTSTDTKELPIAFSLSQNYPNPFNPETTIEFSIPNSQFAILKVYDVLGREVATLVNEVKAPGNYSVKFNGSNLPSGVYFCRLSANNFSKTIKLSLVK